MTRKTKTTRVTEKVTEFVEKAAEDKKASAPKRTSTATRAKAKKTTQSKTASAPKTTSRSKAAATKTKASAKTTAKKTTKPAAKTTTKTRAKAGSKATAKTTAKAAPKTTRRTTKAKTSTTAKPKSTARKTTRAKKAPVTKAVAPELTGINGTNGHHPVQEPNGSVAVAEAVAAPAVEVEPATHVAEAPSGQFSQAALAAVGESMLNSMKQLFAFGGTKAPDVAQPTAQAEFAPLQRTQQDPTVAPDILQPGPQAEFSEMAETVPVSAPVAEAVQEATTPPEDSTQPAEKPEPKFKDEDLEYVRVIRAMAMVVIVAEHLAFPLIYRYNELLISEWWIGTGIYLFGKAGSPLFTMVSGLLLLNPSKNNQTLQVFFKKRFMKVLIPFLGWSAIYLCWQMYWIGVEYSAKEIMIAIIDGPVYYHLWFIQMILGLYLATPIMRIYTRHTDRPNMTYFLIVWFVGTALFPIVRRFYGFEIGIDIYVTVGFMGYFVLGYYLRPIKLNRQQMMYCLAVIVGFSLLTMGLTHWMVVRAGGKFDNFFALNTSFNIMILTTAFFLFMKSLDYKKIYARRPWFQWVITHVAGTSFGLYLVHVMIIEDFRSGRPGIVLHGMTWHPAIAIPVLTIATMVLSVIIVKRMQKIPYVKNIVP